MYNVDHRLRGRTYREGPYTVATPPQSDAAGAFVGVLDPPPDHWPWALPQHYAVNVVEEPGRENVGWYPTPEGAGEIRASVVEGRWRVETIGYWQGDYRLLSNVMFFERPRAETYAEERYGVVPTRFLLYSGHVVREDTGVRLTGDWPHKWRFARLRDLGVFVARLVAIARELGFHDIAGRLKDSHRTAWPTTELAMNYRHTLGLAHRELGPHLDGDARKALDLSLETVQRWLSR